MLKLIIRQANWGVIGAIFAFTVGFFVKIYVIDVVGLEEWGKYVIAHTFSSFSETFLSIGIPFVILKFLPSLIDKDINKASRVANIFLKYAIVIGLCYVIIIYFTSDIINKYIFNDINQFNNILFLMCLHVPISMLFGVVVSLYRSIFKIKEIVVYGTLVTVSLRALLTFFTLHYFDDISYFILIEVMTQIFVLTILIYLFNKENFKIFVSSDYSEVCDDNIVMNYGKKMFLNSTIAYISVHALKFIMSIKLPSQDVGAYSILLTISGLTTFLLINLNKVFAPAISKLYSDGKTKELNTLYKKTTILVNLITLPLVVIIVLFSDEILLLYTTQMLEYKSFLLFMLIGGIMSLVSGSSGTFMIMAGLENKNLNILIIKSILIIILSFYFIPIYGMSSIVFLYVFFMFFVNFLQVFFIKRLVNISPFTYQLFILYIITTMFIYFAFNQDYSFSLFHYIVIPIFIYLIYFISMISTVKKLVRELIY